MSTKDFRTKTNFLSRDNGLIEGAWENALDIGYSAVKIMAPNKVASFPSYAKKVDENYQYIGEAPKSSILYRDLNSDDIWVVGETAQNLMAINDTSDSEAALYSRDRYYSEMFRVISEVGMGIGLRPNMYGEHNGDKIVVQTGLPERYMGDEQMLKEALSGAHSFTLKIGDEDWRTYSFNLDINDIYVMSQPQGTLFSVITDEDGDFISDAKRLLGSSLLILDPGFGTFDIFAINRGTVVRGETFSDLGMKRILQETSKSIKNMYGVEVLVPAMQKILETGTVRKFNNKNLTYEDFQFNDLLTEASNKVCDEAIARMTSSFNLSDYSDIIITGGTGEAWYNRIKDKLKNLSFLSVIKGNENNNLDLIYSNVRGYYYYRYNKLKQ